MLVITRGYHSNQDIPPDCTGYLKWILVAEVLSDTKWSKPDNPRESHRESEYFVFHHIIYIFLVFPLNNNFLASQSLHTSWNVHECLKSCVLIPMIFPWFCLSAFLKKSSQIVVFPFFSRWESVSWIPLRLECLYIRSNQTWRPTKNIVIDHFSIIFPFKPPVPVFFQVELPRSKTGRLRKGSDTKRCVLGWSRSKTCGESHGGHGAGHG